MVSKSLQELTVEARFQFPTVDGEGEKLGQVCGPTNLTQGEGGRS